MVASLLVALVWRVADRPAPATAGRDPAIRPARLATTSHAPPAASTARIAARRFLVAFLSFEIGAGRPGVRRSLRADASAAFARQLLGAPPAVELADRPPPRLQTLRLHRLPGRPDLVLVSGTALRPSGPEPFAFLFARRRGRWLALAPAE